VARVEVDAHLVGAAQGVTRAIEGFDAVTVAPFRSGSMNDLLPDPERYR